MKTSILIVSRMVVCIVCLALVIVGQKTAGKFDLGMMLVGLSGLLAMLYLYNRKFV